MRGFVALRSHQLIYSLDINNSKKFCIRGCAHVRLFPVIEEPAARTGAPGPIRSIYLRDPDLNLIEIAEPAH